MALPPGPSEGKAKARAALGALGSAERVAPVKF